MQSVCNVKSHFLLLVILTFIIKKPLHNFTFKEAKVYIFTIYIVYIYIHIYIQRLQLSKNASGLTAKNP